MTTSRPTNISLMATVALTLVLSLLMPSVDGATADELGDKQAEAARIADKLDALEMRLMDLSSQAETAKAGLAKARDEVAATQKESESANEELERITSELEKFSVAAYVTGSDDPTFELMVTSSGDQAPQKQGYLSITTSNRRDMVDSYRAVRTRADNEAMRLTEAQLEVEANIATLDRSQAEARSAVERQREIKARIDGELGELVAAEQQRRAEQAARLAEEQAARAIGRSPGSTSTLTATGAPSTQAPSTSGVVGAPAAPTPPAPGVTTPAPTTPAVTVPGPSTPVTPAPTTPPPPTAPVPTVPAAPPAVGVRPTASAAVNAAMGKIGSPYVWAGGGPNVFDCSGLTMWAWAQAGVSLPHYSGSQYTMTRRISVTDAQPGDLIFFWAPGAGGDPSHVGMYIGGNKMVHSPSAGNYVRVDSIYWWTGARIAAGRV